MKRFIMIGAALAVLGGVGAAYAASDFNTYTATYTFKPSKAGSVAKPSPYAEHEVWTAHGTNGHQTAPLKHIVVKTYGIKVDGKDFPVCTASMINSAGNAKGWNKVCPKGSQVGGGPTEAALIPSTTPTASGSPCHPYLFVYNGGQGKQTFFYTETPYAPGPQYTCANGAVSTGSAAAYTGTYKNVGKQWIFNLVVPPAESTMAGGLAGVYASLIKLDVQFPKLTKKVKGKTVAYGESFACLKGKRPYSTTFTAQNYQGQSPSTQTTTVKGSAKC